MNSNISNISDNDTLTAAAPSMGSVALDNAIYISDKAKEKVITLMKDAGLGEDSSYFLRD